MNVKYLQSLGYTGGQLKILDQTLLPVTTKWISIDSLATACEAIGSLRVRGAPAIGVMAALSSVVAVRNKASNTASLSASSAQALFTEICNQLQATRPTAVNLFHATNRMLSYVESYLNQRYGGKGDSQVVISDFIAALEAEAVTILNEDIALCDAIGRNGSSVITANQTVLTHCNTGALATAGRGTALSAIYTAFFDDKKNISVINTETRPLLQGSRLTSYELVTAGIPTTLITDSMAATVMKEGKVDIVMVGADRIARNGDTANKIGTMMLAILASYFKIPFYVLAPSTTVDPAIEDGSKIIIEERQADEVRQFAGQPSAPADVAVYNPAFDVAPAGLISGIITEKGVFRPPYDFSK